MCNTFQVIDFNAQKELEADEIQDNMRRYRFQFINFASIHGYT